MKIAFMIYLLVLNSIGYALMFWDKEKAKRDYWRIPERHFFLISIFGGSIGCWLGMQKFRHKTKHQKFVVGIPLIIFIQILLMIILYGKLFWVA